MINQPNKNPMISVVMPVHNGEKYLEESIKSILSQTYRDFEFIIVNDRSTDSSLEIIEKYQKTDKRINVCNIKQETIDIGFNGIVGALNKGLECAKGKYIARIDDDDISLPKRFEKQVEFLESNPNIFLIGTGAILIDEEGNFVRKTKSITGDENIEKALESKNNPLLHSSIMFRNGCGYKYREKARHCEDFDLYLRLLLDGKKIDNIDDQLIKYRLRRNSISFGNYLKQKMFVEKMLEIYFQNKNTGKDSYEDFNAQKLIEEADKLFTDERKEYGLVRYFLVVNKYKEMRIYSLNYLKKYKFSKNVLFMYLLSFLPKKLINLIKEKRNV